MLEEPTQQAIDEKLSPMGLHWCMCEPRPADRLRVVKVTEVAPVEHIAATIREAWEDNNKGSLSSCFYYI